MLNRPSRKRKLTEFQKGQEESPQAQGPEQSSLPQTQSNPQASTNMIYASLSVTKKARHYDDLSPPPNSPIYHQESELMDFDYNEEMDEKKLEDYLSSNQKRL